ncbi:MAG: hypothetical protein M3N68_02810 [Actinomycetota bacterium]|nr:hypothetical protein [Actinomycetota bacterium]
MTDEIDLTGSAEVPGPDDLLLSELRTLAQQVTPVPEEMLNAARGSFCWRRIDAELASLAHDSVLDQQGNLVRGESAPRLLSFEGPGLTVEVEVAATPTGRRLVGQLVPARRGEVEIRHPGGSITVEADQGGRFRADGVVPGTMSLRCQVPGSSPPLAVETAWVLV